MPLSTLTRVIVNPPNRFCLSYQYKRGKALFTSHCITISASLKQSATYNNFTECRLLRQKKQSSRAQCFKKITSSAAHECFRLLTTKTGLTKLIITIRLVNNSTLLLLICSSSLNTSIAIKIGRKIRLCLCCTKRAS